MQGPQVDIGGPIPKHESVVIAAGAVVRGGYYTLVVRITRFSVRELLGLVPQFVKLNGRSALGARTPQRLAWANPPTSSVIFDQNALLTYLVLPWSLMTSLPNFLFTLSGRCVTLLELELKL